MRWEPVIGLEIHTQLATESKIFSGASTAFGAEPNTQACSVDLGLPGVLPVLNLGAVQRAVRFGRAIDAEIAPRSIFARKNYFYPDLPKGYQISQYELPVVGKGRVEIVLDDGSVKTVGVTRAHLEEDAGKSLHEDFRGQTGIDLNRAGTPLLEIVSEPDMRSPEEAVAYARKIHQLVRWIGISDGNMQEGSFRVDANVSLRPKGQQAFGTRAEIKNINSFRFLQKAIEFEIERQADLLDDGGTIVQETRLYDANKDETRSMRSKEEANDYRYFPDPDLLPVEIDETFIADATRDMPRLPDEIRFELVKGAGHSEYMASQLTATKEAYVYYAELLDHAAPDLAANWVTGALAAALNRAGLDINESRVKPSELGGLLRRIQDGTLSGKIAKQVFEAMWAGEGDADAVIKERGLKQITDTGAIEQMIDAIIAANPGQLAQYRSGKDKLFGFFVGQVMKQSQGKANPQQVNAILLEKLKG